MSGQIIVRTSLVGIVVNILLAAFKAAIKTPVKADATDVRPGQSRPAR